MQHTQDKCQHTINSCMDRLKNHTIRAVRTAQFKFQIHAHLRDVRNVHITVCMYVSCLTSMSTFLRVIDAIKNWKKNNLKGRGKMIKKEAFFKHFSISYWTCKIYKTLIQAIWCEQIYVNVLAGGILDRTDRTCPDRMSWNNRIHSTPCNTERWKEMKENSRNKKW